MKKYTTLVLVITLLTVPMIVFAAVFNSITDLIKIFINIINQSIIVVIALALLFFFWGLANFILHSADETKRAEGRSIMIWGIIALFVMTSVWGLVGVLQNTFLKGGPTPIQNSTNIDSNPFDPLKDNSGIRI